MMQRKLKSQLASREKEILAMFKISLRKLLGLGMLKWIAFLLTTSFLDAILTLNVYTKKVGNHIIILVLYVHDLILTDSDGKLLNHVKSNLEKKFKMTNLGYFYYFQRRRIFFILKILKIKL
jgi:hypothetical protein